MNRPQIEVIYSCFACSVIEQKVMVPARGPEDDVVHWVKNILGHAIDLDHSTRSPHCRAETMDHVKIPITGADKIGGAPVN